ncbi:TPA: 50S ribosomal protein L3 [Candidatus Delongbacteria bacterium]|nr:ribosomal protein L3 [uncultured bacterium]OGE85924.1 MAG: 50S ribosomal protein L3 [Candidatus Delongbacteria bacterium GWF2_40_14]HAQ61165.1 50S ribosomal protein L3 [Candidatus Delongbacteria bacterium]
MDVILGKKLGMASFFGPAGREFPVTIVEAGPCKVVQVKTIEKDKYEAIQLGFANQKESRVNKPLTGHFKKAGVEVKKYLKEFRFTGAGKVAVGTEITVAAFSEGDNLSVEGVSKGKGFQGVVRRWGMRLQGGSHGTHESHRGPGSIGQCTWPSRVWKGKHLPGRMGSDKVTIKNVEVLKTIPEKNIIFIKGSLPGAKNGILKIRKLEA